MLLEPNNILSLEQSNKRIYSCFWHLSSCSMPHILISQIPDQCWWLWFPEKFLIKAWKVSQDASSIWEESWFAPESKGVAGEDCFWVAGEERAITWPVCGNPVVILRLTLWVEGLVFVQFTTAVIPDSCKIFNLCGAKHYISECNAQDLSSPLKS